MAPAGPRKNIVHADPNNGNAVGSGIGAGKLPEIGGGMGKAIRNFKKATDDAEKKDPDKLENNGDA